MDENSQIGGIIKAGLGLTGLGALASVFFLPSPYGIYVALLVVVLFLVLFGSYFLWQRMRARRQREQFTSAIEAQTSAVPKAISDPNKRADLDRVRQKFQTGLQEFKSRGKDMYKLPWYVIIGESGSGKTEAIRHSGIDFPPGMQDELQGSGGTVNMDWWFTNRGIILDTAGSMLFSEARAGEAPEWREFLRLLKRARPHCPINGLFLVLSVESLIRDSADVIAQKASRLAQQLDFIQRALDVRFPVYLLVTKCDLLAGFREFFDNIDDPLLQHQIFGWSNPEPLDSPFRPELVEEHLRSVSGRLRRRRTALIRDTSGTGRLGDTGHFFASTYQLGKGPTVSRRLDSIDSLFALPESVQRLAPRLRRYLEMVFVAGEWSAKPVFLRGIYFTSSMREGGALDEAISLATGIPLDQLPGDRDWEKNRSFFLRDLFHEKVFRESGLVTRATNTLKMLRQRQFAIFGTAGAALLIFLGVSGFAYFKLRQSVLSEASDWQIGAAAANWVQGVWSPSIVSSAPNEIDGSRYAYGGTNLVADKRTLLQYHKDLKRDVDKRLEVSWIFKPMAWVNTGNVRQRSDAQRLLFEASVLKPLVTQTRSKMSRVEPTPASMARYRDALLSLIALEADALNPASRDGLATPDAPRRYLKNLLSYLTEEETALDPSLVNVFLETYSQGSLKQNEGTWPPKSLAGGAALANHVEIIKIGLEKYQKACVIARTNIDDHLKLVNKVADKLEAYQKAESAWLKNKGDSCSLLGQSLIPAKADLDRDWSLLSSDTNFPAGPLTSLAARYDKLAAAASNASAATLSAPVNLILSPLSTTGQGLKFTEDINTRLKQLAGGAAENVLASRISRSSAVGTLDLSYLATSANDSTADYVRRWSLYTNACSLKSETVAPDETIIGNKWQTFDALSRSANIFRTNLNLYSGPFAADVTNLCNHIAREAEQDLQSRYVEEYGGIVSNKFRSLTYPNKWTAAALTNATQTLLAVAGDLAPEVCSRLGAQQAAKLESVRALVDSSKHNMLDQFSIYLKTILGFPVLLDSPNLMKIEDLADARRLLDGMEKVLAHEIWQSSNNTALTTLRANSKGASEVMNSLVTKDGVPAEWQLSFVPPTETDSEEDRVIITVFRAAFVSSGATKSSLPDLSRADPNDTNSCALGKVAANAGLTISFRLLPDDPGSERQELSLPDWALVRLIQNDKAKPLGDPTKWRFKIPLSNGKNKGAVTFEARLEQPLPKKEAWLKSR